MESKIRNSKFESRNKFEIRDSGRRQIDIFFFVLRICFGFRDSYFVFLGALIAVLGFTSHGGALEPLTDRPYKIRIVLQFAEHRVLTPLFKDELTRAVGDQVRLALGSLAEVEVVRHHPLLAELRSKGLPQAVDGCQELSDRQTHFVIVDYRAGRFALSARLHDGVTGLNSPDVRRIETGDRGQLASAAARLVYEGLGVVGTIVNTDPIEVALQGGGLNVPFDDWVKPGDIFAVTRIIDDGEQPRSVPLTWAVLRVRDAPKQGVCRGEYFCRYAEDLLAAGAGYRCLKLSAARLPLSIRFLDADSLRPLPGLQVHVGRRGFQESVRELSTDLTGLAATRETFDGIAFVKVLGGGKVHAQLPVVLTDMETVVCRLKLEPQSETLALLHYRRDEWLRRILDALLVTSARMRQLNVQLGTSLDTAQSYARLSLEKLEKDLASLDAERQELTRQAATREIARLDTSEGDERLKELRRRREELAGFLTRVESSIKDSKSGTTLNSLKLLERARLLENEAEYDQAISMYEDILKKDADQPKVRDYLSRLKQAWQLAGKDHAEAREFIMQTWPALDLDGLKANIDRAKHSLKICLEKGDTLTPRKLLHANLLHVANLKKRLTALQRQEGGGNRSEAPIIAEVAEVLRALHEQATASTRKN